MSERLTTEQIEAIKARREKAAQLVIELTKSRDNWRMSIPRQPDDSDELLLDVTDDIDALLAALEAERADNERLRGQVELFKKMFMSGDRNIADTTMQTGIAPAVNPAAGQDGGGYDGDVLDRGSDASRYIRYRDEAYESGAFPMNFSQWLSKYGQDGD